MRIVSKKLEKLASPIPVFDVTNLSGTDNFTLANGVVVHNCMRSKTDQKALESEEIINILGAIGFDPNAADPYTKLRAGKIICLADPDPDGPLAGHTELDIRLGGEEGEVRRISMRDLHRYQDVYRYERNQSIEVQTLNGEGNIEWTESQDIRITGHVTEMIQITLEDGSVYDCSTQHRWALKNAVHTDSRVEFGPSSFPMIKSKDLTPEDSLVTSTGSVKVASVELIQLTDLTPVYCLTVPFTHTFVLPSGVLSANCHINSLLLTLFYKFLPELFKRGMIYVAETPEFYAINEKTDELIIGDSVEAVRKKQLSMKSKSPIHHIKGWGEINTNVLRLLAMDPSSRRLIKIDTMEKAGNVEFTKLMGEDVETRRKLIGV